MSISEKFVIEDRFARGLFIWLTPAVCFLLVLPSFVSTDTLLTTSSYLSVKFFTYAEPTWLEPLRNLIFSAQTSAVVITDVSQFLPALLLAISAKAGKMNGLTLAGRIILVFFIHETSVRVGEIRRRKKKADTHLISVFKSRMGHP